MGGGGSYNPNLSQYLRDQLPNTRVAFIDEIGIPVGAKEALGFALLGCECFVGRPMIVPKRTESDAPGVVGQIQPGKNHHRLRQHVAKVSLCFDSLVCSILIVNSCIASFGTISQKRRSSVLLI